MKQQITVMMRRLAIAFLASISLAGHAMENHTIMVMGAQVRAMPPGSANSAAYMTLMNHSEQDRQLIAVESDVAKFVELHQHSMVDGNMQMRQVNHVSIEANGRISLQPGGYHIMMIGLQHNLVVGESVSYTLVFANGERQTVDAPIVLSEDIQTSSMMH